MAPDAAQQLLESYTDASLALPEGLHCGFNPNETLALLREKWGADFDANLKLIQDTTRALGPKVCAWLDRPIGLDGHRLSDDPAMIQALYVYAKGYTRVSPAEAQKRLDKIMSDQKHPYWSGQKAAVTEVRELRKRVSGTAGKASATRPAVKAPAEPSGRAKVEARIKELKVHPAYFSRDHASHKEVVAQVSALYQQLTGMDE